MLPIPETNFNGKAQGAALVVHAKAAQQNQWGKNRWEEKLVGGWT